MNLNTFGNQWRNCARLFVVAALVLIGMTQAVRAQEPEEQKPSPARPAQPPESTVTIYLTNATQQQEANDHLTAVRNMLPHLRAYYDSTANAILLHGTADDLTQAQKIIADLDKPKKAYRVGYTIRMMDGTKPVAAEHYTLIVVPGERAQLKLGNRVPLVTGKAEADAAAASSQVQYMDVGLSISATLSGSGEGLMLRTKLEQSTLADEKSGMGPQDPLLHQAVLENASTLTLGKALTLGSMDIPGGTQRLEVEVVADPVK